MPLVELIKGEKKFINRKILTEVDLQINPGDRIGLIGSNGQGKTTLLKIIMNEIELDNGQLKTKKNLSVGYLPQVVDINRDITLYEFMLENFEDVFELQSRLRKMELDMGHPDENVRNKAMQKYPGLMEEFKQAGGYEYESRIKGILKGLGFLEKDFDRPLISFSGGEKTRAYLARLLLQEPELLLLDEPTNHLDIPGQEWLENFLQNYSGAILVVSHDRYFLDQLTNRIWELIDGQLFDYRGNFSSYLKQREVRFKEWERRYKKQQEKIARWEEYIRRNIAGVNSKQAKGRRKQLENMERIPPPPKITPPMKLTFQIKENSGYEVLKGKAISKSFKGKKLFSNLNFAVTKGERIALVGSNGTGKSTLLKIIAGRLEPDHGELKYGTNVQIGYYDQELMDLMPGRNLVQELISNFPLTEEEARNYLGGFLFRGDDVFELIKTLSGGEKSRLSLLKLMLKKANFLLLDEPTNHLDIRSREILEEALQYFPGTMIVISHDRYFLEKMVNRVWHLTSKGLEDYRGNYNYFVQKRKEKEEQRQANKVKRRNSASTIKRNRSHQKKDLFELEKIEEKIRVLEAEKAELEEKFSSPELYQDREKALQLENRYSKVMQELESIYSLWEKAIE